jgi:hypothetical protein
MAGMVPWATSRPALKSPRLWSGGECFARLAAIHMPSKAKPKQAWMALLVLDGFVSTMKNA